jgi:hypothetical protein
MKQNLELLELLNTLIIIVEDNTMILNKTTFQYVLTCLQVMQAIVKLLQTQTQIPQDELQQKNLQCSELVTVQNNPLFDDDNGDSIQQPV